MTEAQLRELSAIVLGIVWLSSVYCLVISARLLLARRAITQQLCFAMSIFVTTSISITALHSLCAHGLTSSTHSIKQPSSTPGVTDAEIQETTIRLWHIAYFNRGGSHCGNCRDSDEPMGVCHQ